MTKSERDELCDCGGDVVDLRPVLRASVRQAEQERLLQIESETRARRHRICRRASGAAEEAALHAVRAMHALGDGRASSAESELQLVMDACARALAQLVEIGK